MNDEKFYQLSHSARFIFDPDGQQEIFEYLFQPTFKESANLSRSVYFTSYVAWTGKVRELILSEIGGNLVEKITTGEWGLVTNWAEVRIVDEVYSFELVLARFRIGKVSGSVIPLRCEFYKILDSANFKPLGWVEQETTWVEVIGHGRVRPAPFPDFLENFLERTRQKKERSQDAFLTEGSLNNFGEGDLILQAPLIPGGLPVIAYDEFLTTLEDSNLVGNVYYANYFIWQGRVRDKFFQSLVPQQFRGLGKDGELFCSCSRLDYLRDAMPFDKIYVSISIQSLYEMKAVLKYEYYRVLPFGKKEKLAVGQHEVYWVSHHGRGRPETRRFPEHVIQFLLENGNFIQDKKSA